MYWARHFLLEEATCTENKNRENAMSMNKYRLNQHQSEFTILNGYFFIALMIFSQNITTKEYYKRSQLKGTRTHTNQYF